MFQLFHGGVRDLYRVFFPNGIMQQTVDVEQVYFFGGVGLYVCFSSAYVDKLGRQKQLNTDPLQFV